MLTKRFNLYTILIAFFLLLALPVVVFFTRQSHPLQQQAAGASCIGIEIPAYYGPGTAMDKTIAAAGAVKIMVANVNSGPGGSTADPSWASAINQAKAAGIRVMGYVDTAFGNDAEASVKAEVDQWKKLYGVTDIMFDDTWQADTGKISYYQDLTNYVHQQTPGAIDKDNAGDVEPEAYVTTADILGIFEGSYSKYQQWTPPSWIHKYPSSKFMEELYSVPDASALPAIFSLFQKNNAGYIMLTDSNNPWNEFSSDAFWSAFISTVKADCNGSGATVPTVPQVSPVISNALVPSGACLGSCPTLAATPTLFSGVPSGILLSQPVVSLTPGQALPQPHSPGTNTGGNLIQQLLGLLEEILKLLERLIRSV